MSAIGAHALARGRAVVIANVGTALTIDAVTAERPASRRRHRSRPATMVASLLAGTHGIRRRARRAATLSVALAVRHRHRERAGRGLAVRRRGVHRSRRAPRRSARLAAGPCCSSPAARAPMLKRHLEESARVRARPRACAASRCSRRLSRRPAFATLAPRVRAALLLLLLANLAFFAWIAVACARARPQLPVSPKVDAPRSQLVARVQAAWRPAMAAASPSARSPPTSLPRAHGRR